MLGNMHHTRILKLILTITSSVLMMSCANAYDHTVRTADPPHGIHRIFVAVQLGNKKHERFSDHVMETITKRLEACGVVIHTENHPAVENSLSLTNDPNDIRRHISEFAPDYVLYISEATTGFILTTDATSNRYQAFIHLPNAPIGNNIWHTDLSLNTLFSLNDGATLADEVYERMQKDKMLPQSCSQPKG